MKWLLSHEEHGTKPWAVQVEAMRRSEGRDKYGYWLEQGLGKTALTLNDALNQSSLDGMVVTVPNSFKGDWPLAPAEWGVPDVVAGMWPDQPMPHKQSNFFLYAINYEAATRPGKARDELTRLLEQRRLMLVVDESSAIKNPQSQTAKAMIGYSKLAAMVRELNGTPMVQNVLDWYAQLRALGELNGFNPFAFRNRFAKLGGYMGREVVGIDPEHEAQLYQIIDRCSFRALKIDWRKDLPAKMPSTPVHLTMTKRQFQHYKEMMEDFYTLVNDTDVSADMVLTQMDKLRQISSCVAIQDGRPQLLEEPKDNPKVKAVLDILAGGSTKAIVVYFYKASGQLLFEQLIKEGYDPAWIKGGMKPDDLQAAKNYFNKNSNCRVLVAQEEATSRGHTLIGGTGNDRCTRMLFYENSFSLLHRLQMEDRIHRGAQDQVCSYYDLLTSPMDQKVVNALTKKQAAASLVDSIIKAVRNKEW